MTSEITFGREAESWGELPVHVLAQLPSEATLELVCGRAELERVRRIARAYGIESRMDVSAGAGRPSAVVTCAARSFNVVPAGANKPPDSTMGSLIELLTPAGLDNPEVTIDDSSFAGQRVALVTNLPAPYRIPLFSAMSRRLTAAGGALRVIFAGRRPRDRPWIGDGELDFPHEFGAGFEPPIRRGRDPVVMLDLPSRLRAFRPTIILSGGFSPLGTGRALGYARRRGIPFGVWSGAIRTGIEARTRLVQRRWILARSDFAIAYGTLAAEYLRGMFVGPIVIGRNTSDPGSAAAGRRGADGIVELITIADLNTPRKGVDVVIDALRERPSLACRLTVVGGGRLLDDLRQRAASDPRIRFVGPRPHSEIGALLDSAEIYLFPTRGDVFGLALVEAMGAGLAVVSSDAPGAIADLAARGLNCTVVSSHRPSAWGDTIEALIVDDGQRLAMGCAARRTIEGRWSIAHAANAMLAGLSLASSTARSRQP